MPEISPAALDFLDVLVSEDLTYSLSSPPRAGQLGKELTDAGYATISMRMRPFRFPPNYKECIQFFGLLISGTTSRDLDYQYQYFLEPTPEGIDYLDKHRKELFSDISLEALKLLAGVVLEGQRPPLGYMNAWLPSNELLEAGYAEVYGEVTAEFPMIPDTAFFSGASPLIQVPPPIIKHFLRPTKEGIMYITDRPEELAELAEL